MKAKSGFTLVEILIVVVILGILAAIVIPQFTDASTEAKQSRLMTDLQSMRAQIELYKIQHNDCLPGVANANLLHTAGSGFVGGLTDYTDVHGETQSGPGPNIYGPYIQRIPTNPFNQLNSVTIDTSTTDSNSAGGAGWYFNTVSGNFRPDDDGTCLDGATLHINL
ncbi:MAG: prepilin-type N-terminal cleavage/methylation domain-containing protein [Planctomycetota bacterium]|jgi:general secretion pathway protein G